jgi:hypothetical protein
MVEVTLDGMRSCRSWDYDYFVIMSGQCYPIKPLSLLREELDRKNVAHIEYFKLPSIYWEKENGGLNRIHYYHIATADEGYVIRIPRFSRTLPYGLEPYGGSGLCCLPRRFVEYTLDYVSSHPKIIDFYKYSYLSGEMFFQTIIMNSPLKGDVMNDNMWYVRWPGDSRGHPPTLGKEDFDEIMRSDKFFARKFDVNIDSDILDLIDRQIQTG